MNAQPSVRADARRMPAAGRTFIDARSRRERTSAMATLSRCPAGSPTLLVERGVKPGDRVAVQVEKCAEALVLYLATASGPAPSTCRSTPPIRWPSSTTSSAMPSRRVVVCEPEGKRRWSRWPACKGVAAVETLGTEGERLPDARKRPSGRPSSTTCDARPRRSRRDPLHLRHDRPLQGRDADPRQSRRPTP